MDNLKKYLKNWEDIDVASFYLGCVLGIFEDDSMENFRENKGTFWTNNSLGDFLYDMLSRMSDENIIEMDYDKLIVRWKDNGMG